MHRPSRVLEQAVRQPARSIFDQGNAHTSRAHDEKMTASLSHHSSNATSPVSFEQLKRQNNEAVVRLLQLSTIYDADPRPTLIVDTATGIQTNEVDVVYFNPALEENRELFTGVKMVLSGDSAFRDWVLSLHDDHYCRHGGALWFGFSLQHRWRVISTATLTLRPEDDKLATSTLSDSKSPNLTSDERASYEMAIAKLKEETRLYARERRQAIGERRLYEGLFHRLEEDIREARSTASSANESEQVSEDDEQGSISPERISQTPQHNHTGPDDLESRIQELCARPEALAEVQSSAGHFASRIVPPVRETGEKNAISVLEKFQQLADAVNLGFFDYDTEGRLLYANDSWYALSGHPRAPEMHTALTFNQCVYPDDAELVTHEWKKLLGGQATTFEMRWKIPAGPDACADASPGAQWVLSACVPVIGDDGKVKSISGCTTDINAQKMNEQVALQRAEALERARTSEERFSRFAEVAPIALFRLDRHRNLEYCNDRWFEMTGITKTQCEDVKWPFGIFEDDVAVCAQAWENASPDHSIGQIEFRFHKEWHGAHERQGPMWVCCSYLPEYSEDGSFNGLTGSLLDISHIKWAENMQKSRAEEALKAKQQQEDFIDITSHEMRNPLSAMVQCADTIMSSLVDVSKVTERLAHGDYSAEHALLEEHVNSGLDAVQTILSCAAHQKRIVDDVLTLSKLDSNLLVITPIATNPMSMVRDVLKMFEMDCSHADVELRRESSPSFDELDVQGLMLDPSRVSQILINLLGNAIKFTKDEAKRKVTVRMSVSSEPPSKSDSAIDYVPAECIMDNLGDRLESESNVPLYLKLEVQDTGRGLTPKEKDKLFMRFSQASPKTHVQYGGSGLGLFICKKLTEMQGGEIGFASVAGVGSTFAFYIRTWKTASVVSELNGCRATATPERAEVSVFSHETSLNVLLVEDNVVNQKVLRKQLEGQGCIVHVAGHGEEALEFLQETNAWAERRSSVKDRAPDSAPITIDAVLMDIEMPIMSGLECTRQIRELERKRMIKHHLPIISISANARREQVDEAQTAGVDDTIAKPFRIKELMPKLYRLVSSRT